MRPYNTRKTYIYIYIDTHIYIEWGQMTHETGEQGTTKQREMV